jgi:DNA-binding transcriptional LysR family regulator
MHTPRPSLNALRAFEVAARLGSVTAAAGELGVSHSAVSHHIAAIEALFGIPLLRRLAHSVEATEEGRRLASQLTEGFRLIDAGVKLLQPAPLKISCSSTIMMHWLIPRLGTFKKANPKAEIRLNVSFGMIDFIRDEISVAIRLDRITPPKEVTVDPLMREEIGPVCAPSYLAQHPITRPEDLKDVRRLASVTRPNAWREWSQAAEADADVLSPHETYEHFYLQNQAAACGLGVGVSPRILVLDHIAEGRLVAPLGFVAGPHNLVLWIAPHLRLRPDLRALVGWLKSNIQETLQTNRQALAAEIAKPPSSPPDLRTEAMHAQAGAQTTFQSSKLGVPQHPSRQFGLAAESKRVKNSRRPD